MAGANGASEPEVFNLDTLVRENAPKPFGFTLEGQRFVLSDPNDLDWHSQEELASGDLDRIFGCLLGPDQFAEFDKLPAPNWKLEALTQRWAKHYGIELPESPASPTSSASTEKPSRPTSSTTTASGSRTSRPAA